MYSDNDWYGHKRILADYCGQPQVRPIFGAVRHGWDLEPPADLGKRRLNFAPLFVWNERVRALIASRGIPNVRCVGAPFGYLVSMLLPDGPPGSGHGTILFPAHSSDGVSVEMDTRRLITLVESESPPPHTVSIFYQDLASPNIDLYRRRGWRVVSFGARSDPLFLVRFVNEVSKHSHAVGADPQIGSAIIYSALLGLHIRVVELDYHIESSRSDVTILELTSMFSILRNAGSLLSPQLFVDGLGGDDAVEFGRQELGWSSMLNPIELRRELGWATPSTRLAARLMAGLNDLRLGRGARRGFVERT